MLSNDKGVKTGFVTILGNPNVGKSTILNMILDEKVAITSNKAQTTRKNIRGIYNDNDSQIIFIDTPGIQKPKNKLGSYMLNQSQTSTEDVNLILYVIDATFYPRQRDIDFINSIKKNKTPLILIINKIDKISNEEILKKIDFYSKIDAFNEIIPVSALKGTNKKELISTIKSYLNTSYRFYPENMVTDQNNYTLISEIIREKLLRYLDKEIPHGIAVEIESLTDDKEKDLIEISAIIYCEKDSHKKIIIGKDGRKLKGVGKSARKELEEIFGCKVFLSTWVKVKDNWRNNDNLIKNFGFEIL